MATRNKRAKITVNTDARTVTFQPFVNGSTDLSGQEFVADAARLPENITTLLVLDRIRNKLMDSYSDPTADVIESVRAVWDNLVEGNWSVRGEAAERTSLFVEAYAELAKRPVDEIRAVVNRLEMSEEAADKQLLKDTKANAQLQAKMKQIAAARAAEAAKKARDNARGAGAVELPTLA